MPSTRRLLLCEGFEDVQFFKRLIEVRQLADFRVRDTSFRDDTRGGIDKIGSRLAKMKIEETADFQSFSDILIVADKDDNAQQNFDKVCAQLEMIFPGNVPSVDGGTSRGRPRITVIMVPTLSESGTLERQYVDALRNRDREAGRRIDDLLTTCGYERWNSEKRYGKAWVRANLAIRCERDPGVTLGDLFRYHADLVDFRNQCLNPLAEIIERVGALSGVSRARPAQTPALTRSPSRRVRKRSA